MIACPGFDFLLNTKVHSTMVGSKMSGCKPSRVKCSKPARKYLIRKKIELYGAGRTDAGVHALGQVAHLDVPTEMHAKTLLVRLNEILPYDINVLKLEKCDDGFHARYNAVARSYVYIISRRRSAFGKRYVWWVKEDLSVSKMQEASAIFKGFHDFSSFGAATAEEKSTLADISYLDVRESGNQIIIHILGSHFLWMMVRRITGVLVHAGKGKLTVEGNSGFYGTILRKAIPAFSTTIGSVSPTDLLPGRTL